MDSFLGIAHFGLFACTAAAVVVVPGPNTLYVLCAAIARGPAGGLAALSAIIAGDILYACAGFAGIAAILASHETLFAAVRTAGALYLAWLGASLIASAIRVAEGPSPAAFAEKDCRAVFWRALAVTLTNPKAILFWSALLSQFIDPAFPNPLVPFAAIVGILAVCNTLWAGVLIALGQAALVACRSHGALARVASGACGALFVLFGIVLAAGL